jgi:hypothetical protein
VNHVPVQFQKGRLSGTLPYTLPYLASPCHSAIVHRPVDRPRGHFGRHFWVVVALSGGGDRLEPAPGLLNGQQRRGIELPCGAWVGFSSLSPRASNTKQRFLSWRSGAWWAGPFGKHLPTHDSAACPPPSRLTFPSFLRVEGKKSFRQLEVETCRCVQLFWLVTPVYEFDGTSAYTTTYPDEQKFCLVDRPKD